MNDILDAVVAAVRLGLPLVPLRQTPRALPPRHRPLLALALTHPPPPLPTPPPLFPVHSKKRTKMAAQIQSTQESYSAPSTERSEQADTPRNHRSSPTRAGDERSRDRLDGGCFSSPRWPESTKMRRGDGNAHPPAHLDLRCHIGLGEPFHRPNNWPGWPIYTGTHLQRHASEGETLAGRALVYKRAPLRSPTL